MLVKNCWATQLVHRKRALLCIGVGFLHIVFASVHGAVYAAVGNIVKTEQKISSLSGGFAGLLDPEDSFGKGMANIGDLDGDGISELAVSAYGDDDGANGAGAIWILFLNADGTVRTHQKISNTEGNFSAS